MVEAGEPLQLIDGDGEWAPSEQRFEAFLEQHLNGSGLSKYTLCAVIGCQSSGKSTLLNLLFGTHFDVLDASRGRQQTTRGVWFGASNIATLPDGDSDPATKLLVLDVEGTDSMSRGDERDSFERQSALLALALAEVLVINMWFTDIGRYTASNIAILQ
ncbi:MAG: hypothetical protein MHM6MM_009106, partial [Cercozoa sp. M6MM]